MPTIIGTGGNDVLTGTSGDDTFDLSQGGRNVARGMEGDDTFYAGAALSGDDLLDGGDGHDVLYLDGDYSGGVSLYTSVYDIEDIILAGGHSYDITVNLGSSGPLHVDGTDLGVGDTLKFYGADSYDPYAVFGGAGNDTLTGGHHDDTLSGGAGNDFLDGGRRSDTADYASATGGVTVDLRITTGQSVGGGQGEDTLVSIENLAGSAFADVLNGDAGDNTLNGGGGADTLIGHGGDDVLNLESNGTANAGLPISRDHARAFGAAIPDTLKWSGYRLRLLVISNRNTSRSYAVGLSLILDSAVCLAGLAARSRQRFAAASSRERRDGQAREMGTHPITGAE